MNDAVLIDVSPAQCRVSLMQRRQGGRPRFAHNFEFDNAGFGGVGDVLEHYRGLLGVEKLPPTLGVSFGGPVRGRTSFFNGTWTLSLAELKRQFGFARTFVINDVAALAAALPWLGDKDLSRISPHERQAEAGVKEGRYAVIYADHGLCAAALTYTRHGYEVIDTEAGHTAFAPSTPLEFEVLRCLGKTFGRVSNERLLSNPGLVNIHRAICEIHGLVHTPMTPLEILLYARTNADAACVKTLDVFFTALGAFAGDVALSLCSEGGVYLFCGAVAEAGSEPLRARLRETFEDKGQFREFVSAIPTLAITNNSARLVGLSWFACETLKDEEARRTSSAGVMRGLSLAMTESDQTIVILDGEQKIVSVTGAACDDPALREEVLAIGADFAESLARMDTLGVLGLAREDSVEGLIARLRRGEEFTVVRRLFGGRVCEMRARPVSGGGHAIIERDVTELRRRTCDLENLARDLRAASSAAETASRAKSQFLANMSHEIRTPLNGVLGMADILGRTRLTPEQKEMVDTVIVSGNGLLTVINDVLDFSKIEADKMRLAVAPFNLRASIEDTVAALAPSAEKKNLELIVRLDPALCAAVTGDEGRVRQIVTNVAGNAIKFTAKGHVLIDAASVRRDGDVEVTLSVTDTGCGIPKDKLDDVFGMFEQVDGSASRHHEGTGLGLAITRRLLGLMKGAIAVESELGVGTTFRMRFMLGHDAAGETLPTRSADLLGKAVLIVDDNAVNRQILEEQARSWGMVPTSVPGGAEALALLKDGAAVFAVAILDYQMPGMNGLKLAESIKANPANIALPLLLLTSVGQMGDLDREIGKLFDAIMIKPARTGQLAEKIRAIVGRASQNMPQPLEAAVPQEPATAPPPEPSAPVASGGGKITVLVAEDNPINHRVIQAMLADGGYEVHFAWDGVQAVESWRKLRPQIVLMDISMPNLDGFGATAQIRKLEAGSKKTSRVIGLTAHAMPEDRQSCLDAGMDDYLPKPINRDSLIGMLRRHHAD